MTDLDRERKHMGSSADLGRARKRKMKRAGMGEQPVAVPGNTRATHRGSGGNGPSIRERLADSKAKLPSVPLPKIQEKLSLKRIPGSKKSSASQAAHNSDAFSTTPAPRSPHRKAESRRLDSTYQATPHTETKRKAGIGSSDLPRKNRRVFESRADSAPPVMVRGGMNGMAFGRTASATAKQQKAPRRRIDLPLNVPGAEMRLPAIPMLHLGWRAVSFLMVLMMAASLVLIWKAPVFQVSSIKAQGLQRLTVSDLNAVMRATNRSIFMINPAKLTGSLHQAFPELSKIAVKVSLPASVQVVATERQPVIDWVQDGSETWIDTEGVSFPIRGTISDTMVKVEGYGIPPSITLSPSSADTQIVAVSQVTPTMTITPTLRLPPDLVTTILALGAKMPPDTVLVYDSEHGLGWNDPKGWDVFFGAEDQDMQMKLAVYQSLVERLESQGIQPALISVEYVHAPYYRMER